MKAGILLKLYRRQNWPFIIPFWSVSGLTLTGFHLSKVSKACAKLNPAEPPPDEVTLSLDKVLKRAVQFDNLEAKYDDLVLVGHGVRYQSV